MRLKDKIFLYIHIYSFSTTYCMISPLACKTLSTTVHNPVILCLVSPTFAVHRLYHFNQQQIVEHYQSNDTFCCNETFYSCIFTSFIYKNYICSPETFLSAPFMLSFTFYNILSLSNFSVLT